MKRATSKTLFVRSQHYIPGGVNSPVRAFRSVGGHPLFINRAQGATVTDVDGNTYLDYVASWGPMILGHAHPSVVRAIQRAAGAGRATARRRHRNWNWLKCFAKRSPPWTRFDS